MADYCDCFCVRRRKNGKREEESSRQQEDASSSSAFPAEDEATSAEAPMELDLKAPNGNHHVFTYEELKMATNDFSYDNFLGFGGFGCVFRGYIEGVDRMVAVKNLNRRNFLGEREYFPVEVLMLFLLRHPNLVEMMGYCSEGSERLLVYEYMPLGSLEDHLTNIDRSNLAAFLSFPPLWSTDQGRNSNEGRRREPLNWNARLSIAAGVAKGLFYLHKEAIPPVVCGGLKPSNILLDEGFRPRLSDFGLSNKLRRRTVTGRALGVEGYFAPECVKSGTYTTESDIFSFGVVLLEMVTGYRAADSRRGRRRENLVEWLRPALEVERNLAALADPKMYGQFSEGVAVETLKLANICVREDAAARPGISEVVSTLDHLLSKQMEEHRDASVRTGGEDGTSSSTREQQEPNSTGLIPGPLNLRHGRKRPAEETGSPASKHRQTT